MGHRDELRFLCSFVEQVEVSIEDPSRASSSGGCDQLGGVPEVDPDFTGGIIYISPGV